MPIETVTGNGWSPDLLTWATGKDEPEKEKSVNNKVTPNQKMDGSVYQALFEGHKEAHVLQQQAQPGEKTFHTKNDVQGIDEL